MRWSSDSLDRLPNEPDNNFVRPENIFDIGANYVDSFGNFRVSMSTGFQITGDANRTSEQGAWMSAGGVRIGYGGFSFGASAAYENDPAVGIQSRQVIGAGISYASGPASVSLNAVFGEAESSTGATDDRQSAFELGVGYDLGPGVNIVGSAYYLDRDFAFGETKGFVIGTGIKLSF